MPSDLLDHGRSGFYLYRDTGQHVEVSLPCDATMGELVSAFRAFALAAGYQPETVERYLMRDD